MYRTAITALHQWKNSAYRKPLIIQGARQVGKTWIMREFGQQAYENTVYINFDSNSRMSGLFGIFPKLVEIKLSSNGKTWYNKHKF